MTAASADANGVFLSWCTAGGGRRIDRHAGSMSAPVRRIPVRDVLDWADQRITASDWCRVDQLGQAWTTATAEVHEITAIITAADRSG